MESPAHSLINPFQLRNLKDSRRVCEWSRSIPPGEGRSDSPALLHTRRVELRLLPRLGPPKSGVPSISTRTLLTAITCASALKKTASKFRTDLGLRQSIKTQSIPLAALGWLFWASSGRIPWIAPRLFLPVEVQRIQPLRPLLR